MEVQATGDEAEEEAVRLPKYTVRKHLGDDLYSWAVFKNGRPVLTGQSRSEAQYERDRLKQRDRTTIIQPSTQKNPHHKRNTDMPKVHADIDSWSPTILPKGFKQDAVKFIEVALTLGWDLTIHDGNSVTLASRQTFPPTRISLNTRTKSNDYSTQLMNRVVRFADPARIALMKQDAVDVPAIALPLRVVDERIKPSPPPPTPQRCPDPDCSLAAHGDDVPHKPYRKGKTIPTPAQVAERIEKNKTVIVVRPLLARYNRGRGDKPGRSYPSGAISERLWSDGTTDYVCPYDKCGGPDGEPFSADTPGSVKGHWQSHVRAGEVQPAVKQGQDRRDLLVDDPTYDSSAEYAYKVGYTPRPDRVAALAAHLATLDDLAPENAAEACLRWYHDQHDDPQHRPPLTADETLARIRSLVDRGEYAEQRALTDDLAEQVQGLEEQLAQERQRSTDAQARAERAHATLETFRELVNQEVADNQT